jgi:integrase
MAHPERVTDERLQAWRRVVVQLYPAVLIALNTCMRYSELRLLRWGQVDLLRLARSPSARAKLSPVRVVCSR